MGSFSAQLVTAVVAAIIGGVVSILSLTGGWFYSSMTDRLGYQIAENVASRLQFEVSLSSPARNHVDWRCPEGSELVSAVCNGSNPDAQVAVGPRYKPDR